MKKYLEREKERGAGREGERERKRLKETEMREVSGERNDIMVRDR